MAHIKRITPDPVLLSELRAGDCFESTQHSDWVFKLLTGVKQFCKEGGDNTKETVVYAATMCSGEVFQFNYDHKVHPLKVVGEDSYEYDFELDFESHRVG